MGASVSLRLSSSTQNGIEPFDSGGVTRAGAPAFWESMKHKWDNSGLGTKGK